MRYELPAARRSAAYQLQRIARAAIARGDDDEAAALFRTMTDVLTGERPASPEPPAPVDPETARRRELSQAWANTILAINGTAVRR
jgi:hypothetical protein